MEPTKVLAPDEAERHEIRVSLVNGRVVQFTPRELQLLIRSPNVIALLVVAPFLVAAANPVLFPTLPAFSTRFFYWSICVIAYALLIPYWAQLCHKIWCHFFDGPIPHPLASIPFIVLMTAAAEALPSPPGEILPPRTDLLGAMGYALNVVIGLSLETVGLLWLLPLHRTSKHKKSAPKQAEFVVFNGKSVPILSLRTVQSAEHHLIVETDLYTQSYRARMKDFLEQIGDDVGIQTHRSHWVSKQEAVEFLGKSVKTKSGKKVPVSRSRQDAVRCWFQAHGKPHYAR